ncbi:MAG: peptidylprolyl isomerase [Cyclonatronaceae bacterium]
MSSQQETAPEDRAVGTVDGRAVSFADMRASFHNTHSESEADPEAEKQEMMEFLDLYLLYRAKVLEAQAQGYYQDDAILEELEQYQMQSVFPYWLEMRFQEELLDELVERSETEVGVSHILISVGENAAPADTAEAYNTLMEAREAFLNPEDERDFDALAAEYSSRQRGRSMGGDLGYLTAGRAVKAFEDVAYTTEEGEVSMPFRTSFGYHLVYVYDEREAQPQRNYSHIYFQGEAQGASAEEANAKAEEAYAKLNESPGRWEELVREYTEHAQTRENGGDIGWVNPQQYEDDFIDVIERLEQPGDFTEPFTSSYGIHIVRLDSIRTYRSEEHKREELFERLKNLPRYRENREFTLEKVREAANDSLYTDVYEYFLEVHEEQSDQAIAELEFRAEELQATIYRINGQEYSLEHFVNFTAEQAEAHQDRRYRYSMLEQYKDHLAEEVIVEVTKEEFPGFAELSRRYHEGLAVFSLTENEVWNYAQNDTASLRRIYEQNPDEFRYGTRYRFYRISADSAAILAEAKTAIENGLSVDSLRTEISGLILRTDTVSSLEDEPFNNLQGVEEGGFSDVFEYRNRESMLYLAEVLEPRRRTFEEAYMQLVSRYQPIREEEWNEELRRKHRIEPNQESLREILNEVAL